MLKKVEVYFVNDRCKIYEGHMTLRYGEKDGCTFAVIMDVEKKFKVTINMAHVCMIEEEWV